MTTTAEIDLPALRDTTELASRPGAVPDAQLVAAAMADPTGLAGMYDRYADRLYGFCLGVLGDRDAAADCVQDTFTTAVTRLTQLREPDKLRPWLYAIARREALRRLRERRREQPTDELPDRASLDADHGELAARGELAALVRDAAAGLSDRDQLVLELHYRHGLDGPELADALGVTLTSANTQVSRLRETVTRCLGALLLARRARAGAHQCRELAVVLRGWDGQLSVLMRKRIARHLDECRTCHQARHKLVNPQALLAVMPPLVAAPSWLRAHTLHTVAMSHPLTATAPTAAASASSAAAGGAGPTGPGLGAPGTQQVWASKTALASGAGASLLITAAVVALPVTGILAGPSHTAPSTALATGTRPVRGASPAPGIEPITDLGPATGSTPYSVPAGTIFAATANPTASPTTSGPTSTAADTPTHSAALTNGALNARAATSEAQTNTTTDGRNAGAVGGGSGSGGLGGSVGTVGSSVGGSSGGPAGSTMNSSNGTTGATTGSMDPASSALGSRDAASPSGVGAVGQTSSDGPSRVGDTVNAVPNASNTQLANSDTAAGEAASNPN